MQDMNKLHSAILVRNSGKPFRAMKTSRNQECRCGSGLKAKRCCGSRTRYYIPKDKEEGEL